MHTFKFAFFQPLELLWKLLEEWLVIIQVEFENSEPVEHRAKSPESQRMVSSAPPEFLAHLSRRLTGELIVYPCSGVRRRPSSSVVRRPSFTISKIFSSETTWPIKAKLRVEHP